MFKKHIRTIPDFPKPGIRFRDITTLLSHPQAFRSAIETLATRYKDQNVELIAGIEARGFIIGAALAMHLNCGFVPIRKKNKLPGKSFSASYEKEYGPDELHMHTDAVTKNQRVLIVDDLIATGGTAVAAIELLNKANAEIIELACLIELPDLKGKDRLSVPLYTLMSFENNE